MEPGSEWTGQAFHREWEAFQMEPEAALSSVCLLPDKGVCCVEDLARNPSKLN